MIRRKNTIIAFIGILIIAWPVIFLTIVEAETTDEQKQALIGEWTGVWPGVSGDTSTLIIHEIDTEKAKARCTYIISRKDTGTKEYPVLSDFIPGPEPKLEFKLPYGDLKFVLKGKVLQGAFKGAHRGTMSDIKTFENTINMEKKPKK
jgi:hypothetical protein